MRDIESVGTYTGKLVPLLGAVEDDIEVKDIVMGLAGQCRYNGQARAKWIEEEPGWSVLVHSFLVGQILEPEYRLYGYLHDAHEAFTGDIVQPVKSLLRRLSSHDVLGMIEEGLDKAISEKFGLEWPRSDAAKAAIKFADQHAYNIERTLLFHNTSDWGPPPVTKEITAQEKDVFEFALKNPKKVEAMFEMSLASALEQKKEAEREMSPAPRMMLG